MQHKLKVLHVQLLPLLSGVQRVSLDEIGQMNNDFEYSLVCATEGPLTTELNKMNIPCFFIPRFCRQLSLSKDFLALFSLYKLIHAKKFDIVHTHSSKTGVLGRIAAKLGGVSKVIHTVHGYAFPAATSKKSYYVFFFMEWLAKFFTDKLIVLNEQDKKIAINELGYASEKVHVIPNGVNIHKFSPCISSSGNESLKIIMVGRLWPQKDPRTLLLAAKDLLESGVDISISFVGDGELMEELRTLTANHHDKIKFLGWQSNIAEILPQYDLFVLPSLWEGMPLAILEAMSCGLPCLVTNIPGNNDLVKDGYNGYLFEKGDSLALSNLIKAYCLNNDLLRQHSKNARKYVEENYTLKKRNDAVAKLYNA